MLDEKVKEAVKNASSEALRELYRHIAIEFKWRIENDTRKAKMVLRVGDVIKFPKEGKLCIGRIISIKIKNAHVVELHADGTEKLPRLVWRVPLASIADYSVAEEKDILEEVKSETVSDKPTSLSDAW